MHSSGKLALAFFLLFATTSFAQTDSDVLLKMTATRLEDFFTQFQKSDEKWFTEEFLSQVSFDKLTGVIQENSKLLGEIERIRICRIHSPGIAEYELISKSGRRLRAFVQVELTQPHRLNILRFDKIDLGEDSWDKLQVDIQRLPGDHAASVWKIAPTRTRLFSRNSNEPLAVGSSFKLLVLSLLCDEITSGKRKWSDTFPLKENLRSLPSGMMQDWPVGSPVTLHTFATLMVSRSDNTAADHIMHILGREKLEKHQQEVQVHFPERNRPFLRTGELFKIKLVLPAFQTSAYAHRSEEEKRKFLSEAERVELKNPRVYSAPVSNDIIEWFFTTDDLCRIMERLQKPTLQNEALPLLSITKPFDIDDHSWEQLAFKGGAELGVLNLTLLGKLRRKDEWYTLSFTWNRYDQPLNEQVWINLVGRALRLLEKNR